MQNEFFEKMTEMGNASYNSMQELAVINSKALKDITELQLSLVTYGIESGVELTKTLSDITNYKDAISAEADFANDITELQLSLVTYGIESGVGLTKTLGDITNYKDAISAEADFANEYGNKVIEFNRQSAEVLTESRDKVVSWIEKTVGGATSEAARAPKKSSKKMPA